MVTGKGERRIGGRGRGCDERTKGVIRGREGEK